MNITELIMDLRQAGMVRRYHAEPIIGEQTVAAHSWGVVCLIFLLDPEASRELILAAAFHDVAEGKFGDPPAPVKWESQELKDIYDRLEDRQIGRLGIGFTLTPTERALLKQADYLEAMWFCYEQRRYGNRGVDPIFDRLDRHLAAAESNEMAKTLRILVKDKYRRLG